MKVFVTGGSGFIGRALCREAIARGHSIRTVVRSMGKAAILPKEIEIFEIDSISANTDWTHLLKEIDFVVHLAAAVHVTDRSSRTFSDLRNVNVAGTERLAMSAVRAGVKRFIYISTAKVHGEERQTPYQEEDMPAPEDDYSISKWKAEQNLRKTATGTSLEFVILRPPLVYGPAVKANFLKLMNLVETRIPLPFKQIQNRRSMIYVGNLVDIIITCLSNPRASGQTFLVSDDHDTSTPDLITSIASAMGIKPILFPLPPALLNSICKLLGKGDEIEKLIGSLCVDINKVKSLLSWKPPFTFEEGIRETVKFFKET
jgi:UDP-glucose 4-epimerase